MRYVIVIILALGGVSAPAADPVQFDGPRPDGAGVVARRVARLQASGASSAQVADSASAWLNEAGYLEASAAFEGNVLHVTAGAKYHVKSVIVESDSSRNMAVNEAFTAENVRKTIGRVLDGYYDSGYYYARAAIASISRSGTDVSLKITVNEGPIVTIADNIFTGLEYSAPGVVDRMIPVGPGDTLTRRAIREATSAAQDISFLTLMSPPVVRPRAGYTTADLEYRFAEKPRFGMEGGGGYMPDDPVGLMWNFRAAFRNLLGGGREAEITSQRIQKGRQTLDIRYRQPLFLFGYDRLQVGVSTRDFQNEFYEFALDGRFDAGLSPGTTTGLILGWKRVEPADSANGFSRYTAGFTLRRRSPGDRQNPLSGYAIDWSVGYAHRRYADDSLGTPPRKKTYNDTRLLLANNWYLHLAGPIVGHVSANYVGLETSDSLPPLSELAFIGGPGTVRGYRNEQFVAKRAAYGTIEPRLRFAQGYIFLFYDAAYISRPILSAGAVQNEELYRYGIGGGLSLVGEDRAVTLSLGWAQDAAFDQPRLAIELSYDI